MPEQGEILKTVMRETGTSQSELSRLTGVHQPSISQFLSGKVGLSDDNLDRLLSSMGYRLEVRRQPLQPDLNRSEMRSWKLHRKISSKLSRSSLEHWTPKIRSNLDRLRNRVRGEPHLGNLDRWEKLIDDGDLGKIRRILIGLDNSSIEMREVSPLSGVLSENERLQALGD